MSKINDGGPAYPHPQGWRRDPEVSDGMSLRDWFAGQALIIVARLWAEDPGFKPGEYATDAYEIADAMLAARAKGGDADG